MCAIQLVRKLEGLRLLSVLPVLVSWSPGRAVPMSCMFRAAFCGEYYFLMDWEQIT